MHLRKRDLGRSPAHGDRAIVRLAYNPAGTPTRPLLEDVFAWKEERTLTKNLTVQYDKVLFLLEPNELTRSLARQRVTIIDYPDGRIAIRHKGRDLPYRTFDKLQKVNQAAIVENKRLGEVLAYIAARQEQRAEVRSKSAPRRQGQSDRHMFKVMIRRDGGS